MNTENNKITQDFSVFVIIISEMMWLMWKNSYKLQFKHEIQIKEETCSDNVAPSAGETVTQTDSVLNTLL